MAVQDVWPFQAIRRHVTTLSVLRVPMAANLGGHAIKQDCASVHQLLPLVARLLARLLVPLVAQ